MAKTIKVGNVAFGGRNPLPLIAGPCVIESRKICMDIAERLVKICKDEGVPLVFKASYDKANRTSIDSFRGPGIDKGLEILHEVKERFGVPVLTDVHTEEEVEKASEIVDILQLPAFLSRQTDLVVALGKTSRVVNIKKGQFLAPWDIPNVIKKVEHGGNRRILLTERGASFGYNNLVADMRSLLVMAETGYPVIFDATHSVQLPGGGGDASSGDGKWAPHLARAAVATGCNGVFIETHINPARALSDKANAIPLRQMGKLCRQLKAIHAIVNAKS